MKSFLSVLARKVRWLTRKWGRWLMPTHKAVQSDRDSVVTNGVPGKGRDPYQESIDPAGSGVVTGADLLEFAERHVNDDEDRTAGRRATVHGSRQVWNVSSKTLERIKTALYEVARYFDPEAGSSPRKLHAALAGHVGPELLVWDPNAGVGGAGDWRRFLDLVAEVTGGSRRYVGAARSLLDLAATHCVIPRTVRHDLDPAFESGAWVELREDWMKAIRGRADRIHEAVGELLDGCYRVGVDPTEGLEQTEWTRVLEHLEDHFHFAEIDSRLRTAIRGAYRALVEAGCIDGPPWDATERRRARGVVLIRTRHIEEIAQDYGREGDQPGAHHASNAHAEKKRVEEVHPWPGCERFSGLIEGPFGLRAAVLTFTAPHRILKELNLPSPTSWPGQPIRGLTVNSYRRWRIGTCRSNLRLIFFYAGWLQRAKNIDFSRPEADLRVLLDEDNVRAFFRAVCSGTVSTKNQLRRTLVLLARLASPFAEAVAVQLEARELARRFARVSAVSNSERTTGGFASLNSQISEDLEDTYDRSADIAREVENAWTDLETVADFAYDQMCSVRDTLIRLIEYEGGGTLEELVSGVEDGSYEMSRQLAFHIRVALIWADQLQIPLRVATMSLMNVEDRMHNRDFRRLRARIPGWKFKDGKSKAFRPNYRKDPRSPYPQMLYCLYVTPGGARDVLRTGRDGAVRRVQAFYVPCLNSRSARLSRPTFNRIIRAGLEAALAYDPTCLRGLRYEDVAKHTSIHRFRHAFATKMVAKGLLDQAADCLRHSSTEMIKRVYAARDERDHDPGASLNGKDSAEDSEEKPDEPEGSDSDGEQQR